MSKVKVTMENGKDFIIELYPEHAPITVENFVKLVEQNYFDGTIFHVPVRLTKMILDIMKKHNLPLIEDNQVSNVKLFFTFLLMLVLGGTILFMPEISVISIPSE